MGYCAIMAEIKSLKQLILDHLDMRQGGADVASDNIRKASHDFADSDAPQFQGKSKAKRHQMAVAAGLSAARGESAAPKLKVGDKAIYENKKCVIRGLKSSGMATIRFGNNRELIVRAHDLKPQQQLTEGVLGIAAVTPTYREQNTYGFLKLEGLDPEDIGLIFEADDEDEDEEPEEDEKNSGSDPEYGDDHEESADNGSNMRSDGHTGRKEVDELPTPSDTIAPAYSDEKPPKEISEPLSTHIGAQEEHLWDEPEWDGYDYPADAPVIPTADFHGADNGNSRAPHFNDDEHQPGDGREEGDDKGEVDESYVGFDKLKGKLAHKAGIHNPGAVAASIGRKKYGAGKMQHAAATGHKLGEGTAFDRGGHEYPDWKEPPSDDWRRQEDRRRAAKQKRANQNANLSGKEVAECDVTDPARKKGNKDLVKMRKDLEFSESFFMREMDDLLGPGEDTEPKSGDTITVTLPAMAAICCTVANKVGGDPNMLKAIVEALAEVGKGKTIDIEDLDAVAAHVNGEELPEIENREEGHPDHEGMDHEGSDFGGDDEGSDETSDWPGDGEDTASGKTRLMAGESVTESLDFYGGYDVFRDVAQSDEDIIKTIHRRAFPNGTRRRA